MLVALLTGGRSFGQWQHVGAAGFASGAAANISMVIGKNDTPIVGFRDNGAGGGKATVMYYTNNTWISMGNTGFSPNAVNEVSMAADTARNNIYIAYIDSVAGVTVAQYNGTGWTLLGAPGFTANTQSDNLKMLVAPDGTPYLGFLDDNQSYKANMMKYTGGSWSQVGTTNFSTLAGYKVAFAIDRNNVPYAAIASSSYPETVEVQKFDGASWVDVGTTAFDTSSYGTKIALAIDTNNRPYVAMTANASPYAAHVWGYNGSRWVMIGGPATAGDAEELNLAISGKNLPVLSYSDYANSSYKASVVYYNGVSWNSLGNTDFTAAEADFTSLAINSRNDVFVAYEDFANGNGPTVDEYLHNTGIHDAPGLAGFKLYPNPNNGKFRISYTATQPGETELSVSDMMGRIVWQDARTGNGTESIDLSSISTGLYTLQVKTTAGIETRLVEIK
jgi:hypothetical protein